MKDVIAVEPRDGYQLVLTFEGGERREIDLTAFVEFDGVLAPLRDPGYFRQVRVNAELGTIVWPNGADFCPDVLYAESRPASPSAHSPAA